MTYSNEEQLNTLVEKAIKRIGYMGCMIVTIKLKCNHETEYRYTNELLTIYNGEYCWQSDWWEGEEDVEYVGIIPVDEVHTWKFDNMDESFISKLDLKYHIDNLFQKLSNPEYPDNFKDDTEYALSNLKGLINDCINSLTDYND